MTRWANEAASEMRAGFALILANVRYWPSVAPQVRDELRRWQLAARAIPDPVLRGLALSKLRDEHFNAEVAATLATTVDRDHRAPVVSAIVAFQVMYDYLDALSEQSVPDPLANGHSLFSAFAVALTPGAPPRDYYARHPQRRDGGYLQQLVVTCQSSLGVLPAAEVIAAHARRAATECGEAQTRTHAIPAVGTDPLRSWATARTGDTGLRWWELAAGAAAGSLTVHALLATAARLSSTPAEAARIARAYLSICALSTLLDSLADHERDTRDASHNFASYYDSGATASERIATVARIAKRATRGLPDAAHHEMTVAGVAGYYLTAPGGRNPFARPAIRRVAHELRPTIAPVLAIFRLWRAAKWFTARTR